MSGMLSIYAFDELWNLANTVRYGLMALQHRGLQSYVVCSTGVDVECVEGSDIDVAKSASGHVAIASIHNYENEKTFTIQRSNEYSVAIVAERPWRRIDDFALDLVNVLKTSRNRVEAFTNALSNLQRDSEDVVPSLMVLTKDKEVFVWRSHNGFSPIALGSYGFDMAIAASESVAIDILGGDLKKFLRPGEGIYISRHMLKTFLVNQADAYNGLCLFEFLYLSRHDAIINNVSVYEFRKALGYDLGKYLDKEVDVVVGVPETALPYAIGFSSRVGKPFEVAFVATGGRRRSMLASNPFEKIVAIHLKMNPIRSSLEGKKVAIVDDSMVTGSTIKTVSQILRFRVGVREIHLFIASPPLIRSCPYNVMKLDMQNLLAANLSKELAKSYLEVDSLHWLSIEDVDRVARMFGLRFCGRCLGVNVIGGEEK